MGFPAGNNLPKDLFRPFENAVHHQQIVSYADAEKAAVFLQVGENRVPVLPAEGNKLCAVQLVFSDGVVRIVQVAGPA